MGVVGLGLMGYSIVEALVAAGRVVLVCDPDPAARARATALGARPVATAREAAEGARVVVVCVTGDEQARTVALGPDGVAQGQRPGDVLVDCTTTSRGCAEELGRALAEGGAHYVDAPLSLHSPDAAIFVGATPEGFAAAEWVLRSIGRTVSHLGPLGSGASGKLLSQYVTYATFLAAADALRTADDLDLDLSAFAAALQGGSADSWILQCAIDGALGADQQRWGRIDTIHKDLGYLNRLVQEHDVTGLEALETLSARFHPFSPAEAGAPISSLVMKRS